MMNGIPFLKKDKSVKKWLQIHSKTALLFIFLILSLGAYSQNDTIEEQGLNLECNVASRFIWRGTDYGHSPSLQPQLSYTKGFFTLGSWGAYALNSDYRETDFFLDFNYKSFTFSVWDYYSTDTVSGGHYFNYSNNNTSHTFEGIAKLNQIGQLPLSITVGYNFYGSDNTNSVYAELAYSGNYKNIDYQLFCGATPRKGVYADNSGVVNLGGSFTKSIKITDHFSLPLQISLITNPEAENIFLIAAISF